MDDVLETIVFVLEYVHAVTSCFEADDSQSQDFDEAVAQKAINVATKLRQSAIFYSMASSELRDGEFGEATAEVEFKAKTSWIMIRGNRYQVFGHPVTAVLRWMGTQGLTAAQAAAALKSLGVEPSMTTVKIQVSGKANRGAIPQLTDRDAKALLKFKA